jgi:arabinofuranosyltransferase
MNIQISRQHIQYLIFLCILIISILYAYSLQWVSEDAYISFRYARNLIEGQGLVFNTGERVEGYTNFLWTLLLAIGLVASLSPDLISVSLGLICSAGTLICVFLLYRNLYDKPILFPAGLIGFGLNYTWVSFATSGLETSLVCLLASGTFLQISNWLRLPPGPERSPRPLVFGGILLALAMLTRPDTVLIYPAVVLVILVQRPGWRQMLTPVFALTIPILTIYLPYFFWRVSYYGFLFPNTYYAKAANLTYYSQGLVYLWEFIRRYFLWAFLPWPFVLSWITIKNKKPHNPLVLAMAAYCLAHAFYVIRVGGDFMEGRLLLPILPFIYLVIEYALRNLWNNRTLRGVALGALVIGVVINRPIIEPLKIQDGITDERSWAPQFKRWYRAGIAFGKHLPKNTVIATDAVGAFGYGSRLPIIDTLGLTDAAVAHQLLQRRSRPGHEKRAKPQYLRSRKVAILRDGMGLYNLKRPPDFRFAGNRYFLLSKDRSVINGFRQAAAELSKD